MISFNHFPQAIAALQRGTKAAVLAVGTAVQTTAQGIAPVDTGYMRDHIVLQPIDEYNLLIIALALYSIYVEMGTRFMAAQPFMTPAAARVQANVVEICSKIIGAELAKVA